MWRPGKQLSKAAACFAHVRVQRLVVELRVAAFALDIDSSIESLLTRQSSGDHLSLGWIESGEIHRTRFGMNN